MGLACLVVGAVLVPVALTAPETRPEVPAWVRLCGASVFLSAGGLLLVPGRGWLAHGCAAGLYLAIAAVFWWVALFAPAEMFDGRDALLGRAADIRRARLLFGAIALFASIVPLVALLGVLRGNNRSLP